MYAEVDRIPEIFPSTERESGSLANIKIKLFGSLVFYQIINIASIITAELGYICLLITSLPTLARNRKFLLLTDSPSSLHLFTDLYQPPYITISFPTSFCQLNQLSRHINLDSGPHQSTRTWHSHLSHKNNRLFSLTRCWLSYLPIMEWVLEKLTLSQIPSHHTNSRTLVSHARSNPY